MDRIEFNKLHYQLMTDKSNKAAAQNKCDHEEELFEQNHHQVLVDCSSFLCSNQTDQ